MERSETALTNSEENDEFLISREGNIPGKWGMRCVVAAGFQLRDFPLARGWFGSSPPAARSCCLVPAAASHPGNGRGWKSRAEN